MAKVKIFLFIFAYLSCQYVNAYMTKEQMMKAMKTVRNMCVTKTGVTVEALDGMSGGTFDESNQELKCYLGCVMGMMQAVKNNKISLKMVRGQVTKMLEPSLGQRVLTAFESCENTVGDDNCDLAFKFAHCVYKADPEMFVVP